MKITAIMACLLIITLCFNLASCNGSEKIIDTGGMTTTSDTDINDNIDIKVSEKYADYHLINTTISNYWKDIDDWCVSENKTVITKLALCFTDANGLTIYGQVLYEGDPGVYSIERITYGSHDIECSHEMKLSPRLFDIYQADGITIVGNVTIDKYTPLHYYIFSNSLDNYTYICNNIINDGYELRFYTEEGKIFYKKNNFNYSYILQDSQLLIDAFNGGDEFFQECGRLVLIGNMVDYVQEYTMTAEEWYHSDRFPWQYSELRDIYGCDTLEEFIDRLKQE